MASSTGAPFAAGMRDRAILLAGATGRIGGLVARHLHAGGAKLALAVRRPWQVEKLRASFASPTLVGCVPTGDAEAAAGFVKGTRDAFGRLDALIVAVGSCERAEVGKEPSNRALELMEANYLVPALYARAVLPTLRRRNAGRIVLLGALAPERGAPGLAPYLASKAALHAFAASLQQELAGSGVDVAVVVPDALPAASGTGAAEAAPDDHERVAAALIALAVSELPGPPPLFPLPRGG